MTRTASALFLLIAILAAQTPAPKPQLTPVMLDLTGSITENELRGHVSFLASDVLEGRATPSPGLDVAAEYIASQFRAAGLEAAGDRDYFQIAEMVSSRVTLEGFSMQLSGAGSQIAIESGQVALGRQNKALELDGIPVVKIPFGAVPAGSLRGKAVFTHFAEVAQAEPDEQSQRIDEITAFRDALEALHPAVMVNVNSKGRVSARPPAWVTDMKSYEKAKPTLTVTSTAVAEVYESLPAGDTGWTLSLTVAPPETRKFSGRNVVGIVRGSDAALKNTYVLISAHYDHIGTRGSGEDRIFNGANDNASGTATLLEIAEAFAQARPRPRRTLVFVAFFGEELGLLGSRYYTSRPVVPLRNTIANLNFEHTGRTDDSTGSQAGKAAVTGFEFSTLTATLQKAGRYTGYQIVNRRGNEEYFERSDNEPLAMAGVPAHTVVVSVEYPDYHGPQDHWDKLDYPNMARFSRTMAIGALLLANSPEAPQWNSLDPRTKIFREAREKAAKPTE
jgi:hypothetical protein